MRTAACLLAAGLALYGCAGAPKEEKRAPTERELLERSAQLAFSRGRYAQAAKLYQAALDRALIEDRPEPIVDARFNLALTQSYLGHHQAALDLVALAEAERVRRNLAPDPGLRLLRATIHYRAGDPVAAQRILDALLSDRMLPAPVGARAHFLAGLIAADRNDAAVLRMHRDALPASDARGEEADRLELEGRLASIEGDAERALRGLERAAQLRSLAGDYHGMARTLVAAARTAEQADRVAQAAGYWLRAGRSGAQRGEPAAREWLQHARALAGRTGDAALILEADAALARAGNAEERK